jgi:transposase-like protein
VFRQRARRAKIVLACAESGVVYERVAADLGVTTMTVGKWRKRFAQARCDGLTDGLRPRRPKAQLVLTVDHPAIPIEIYREDLRRRTLASWDGAADGARLRGDDELHGGFDHVEGAAVGGRTWERRTGFTAGTQPGGGRRQQRIDGAVLTHRAVRVAANGPRWPAPDLSRTLSQVADRCHISV